MAKTDFSKARRAIRGGGAFAQAEKARVRRSRRRQERVFLNSGDYDATPAPSPRLDSRGVS